MGIQEEIFELFFQYLQNDIPGPIIERLHQTLAPNRTISQDELFNIIDEGCSNGDKNI